MSIIRILAIAAVVCTAVTCAVDVKCDATIVDPKTRKAYYYDLSILHHPDTTYIDSLWYRTAENNIYYVNFCGQTASACDSDDTSVCLRLPNGEDYKYVSGGSTSTQTITIAEQPGVSPADGVTVTYSNGEQCGSGTYKTKIYVNCQKDAEPGFFYDIDDSDECAPILYLYSSAGCSSETTHNSSSSSSFNPTGTCEFVVSDDAKKVSVFYNLSSLHHDDNVYIDNLWYRTDENDIYYVNLCGESAAACDTADTTVCIRKTDTSGNFIYLSGGSLSTQKVSAKSKTFSGDTITISYSDGDKCSGKKRRTNLVVNCEPSSVPGFIYSMETVDECETTLYMYSAAGCGTKIPYVGPTSASSSFAPSSTNPPAPLSSSGSYLLPTIFGVVASFLALALVSIQ